jgi:putative N-acetylmannosamine-6-phosphate epimerase
MPTKKNETTSEATSDQFTTTPATPAVDQLAEIDAQIAALTAQKKAARLAEAARRAEEKAQREAAKVQTLEQVIAAQNAHRQKWVVETLAGRVMARTKSGQSQDEAMREVLTEFEAWAREEIERRLSAKTQTVVASDEQNS